jgi:hypothetical protein
MAAGLSPYGEEGIGITVLAASIPYTRVARGFQPVQPAQVTLSGLDIGLPKCLLHRQNGCD